MGLNTLVLEKKSLFGPKNKPLRELRHRNTLVLGENAFLGQRKSPCGTVEDSFPGCFRSALRFRPALLAVSALSALRFRFYWSNALLFQTGQHAGAFARLAPYSPDLNSAENVFSLKLSKNWRKGKPSPE